MNERLKRDLIRLVIWMIAGGVLLAVMIMFCNG